MEKIVFSAEKKELHRILHWARLRLERKGLRGKTVRRIELAIEEAVINIIRHGYGERQGKIEISMKWRRECVEIFIRDWAPPFDPLAYSNLPNSSSLEEELGGVGLLLMKQVVDEVMYQRQRNTNLLTLVKKMPSEELEK